MHYFTGQDVNRSGAAAERRTLLKPGAQLDLASPYAVPRIGRTESPSSLNYAKLCVELNYTGAAIGEMWGWSCHTSYCIWIIYVEPGFPKIQAGKRLWSIRWWRRQRIERRISWEAGNLESCWFVLYAKSVPMFHHTFMIWNWLIAREDIWWRFLHIWGSARGVHALTYSVRRSTSV